MQRRRFLARASQALTALVSASALARVVAPATGPTALHLQDCYIAGCQYCDCAAVHARLRVGDPLRLARQQPSNPHDPRAIEVFWRAHKLGYLPRRDNASASLLDRAQIPHAEVISRGDPDVTWESVRLTLEVRP